MKKRKTKSNMFTRAGFGKKDFEVAALVLGVITATSSDAATRLKCDHALKAFRRLRRFVYHSK